MNILYLEDDRNDAKLFQLYAKHELPGVNVFIVRTYSEFMRAIHSQQQFAAIICDYSVSGFNGLSAVDIAKKERRGTPVIFVTGARLDLIPEARRSGADYAIEKRGLMDLIIVVKECCARGAG